MAGAVVGPIRIIEGEGGVRAPFYVIPFDKRGNCVGPKTRDLLVDQAAGASDIFVFSHGWNNDWRDAMGRYDAFISEFITLRAKYWALPGKEYAPLLAGVFWPSAALVAPWEQAPQIAAVEGSQDRMSRDEHAVPHVLDLASDLFAHDAATLYELLDRDGLNDEQALEVARLLAPVLASGPDDLDDGHGTPEDLVDAWRRAPNVDEKSLQSRAVGGFVDDDDGFEAEPAAAGPTALIDPRKIIRLASVRLMKDRAGTVGANGVSGLLRRLQDASSHARIHLIGHSYGCKVVLSALCAPDDTHAVKVESVLLLQPAISCYCFASAGMIPGMSGPGGYRTAALRSRRPVVCTFSRDDAPLTHFFHWAVRRGSDLGETVIGGPPPSVYAALGGYGPQGAGETLMDAVRAPAGYVFPAGPAIVGIRADGVIKDHGDVATRDTAWILLNQVKD